MSQIKNQNFSKFFWNFQKIKKLSLGSKNVLQVLAHPSLIEMLGALWSLRTQFPLKIGHFTQNTSKMLYHQIFLFHLEFLYETVSYWLIACLKHLSWTLIIFNNLSSSSSLPSFVQNTLVLFELWVIFTNRTLWSVSDGLVLWLETTLS